MREWYEGVGIGVELFCPALLDSVANLTKPFHPWQAT